MTDGPMAATGIRGVRDSLVSRYTVRPWRVAAVLILGLAACNSESQRTTDTVRRDSAGVQIVENLIDLSSSAAVWRVGPEPFVTIGAVEGEAAYLLDAVRGIVVLSDGRIVVANSGDRTLRWYDQQGRFQFQRGGQGEGPGEFSYLGDISGIGRDSIVAVNWAARRFTTFGPQGGLGQTGVIKGLAAPPGRMDRLPDGSWIVSAAQGFSTSQLGPNPEVGVHRLASPVLHMSSDGSRVDTLGTFPASEIEVMESRSVALAPLGRRLSYAVSGDRVLVGTAERFEIDVYSPGGDLLSSFRVPMARLELTPGLAELYRDALRSRYADAGQAERAEAEREIAARPLPALLPAYASFLVDDDRNVWVRGYRVVSTLPQRYVVLDAAGAFRTVVDLPADLRVFAIADRQLWARRTDDLGVEYVVGYHISN